MNKITYLKNIYIFDDSSFDVKHLNQVRLNHLHSFQVTPVKKVLHQPHESLQRNNFLKFQDNYLLMLFAVDANGEIR